MIRNDTELIHRTLEGDDHAFSSLVDKYKKQVHALAWRIVDDYHIAEEITQDAFLKAYTELGTLREPQSFGSWMYVITRRCCLAWQRKKRVQTESLDHLQENDNEQLEAVVYADYIVEEKERTIADAQRTVVKKLLAKLQESDRTVMTLHYLGEMSCSEIGKFLGVSANTIKSRLRRARQRLKREEPMIREALEHFKITPNLTENIMREVSQTKPNTPSGSKPFVPWLIAASTVVVVLLMLGIGNNRFFAHFQKPYDLETNSEMTVDIVEAPVMANLVLEPNLQRQLGSVNAQNNDAIPEQQPNENLPLSKIAQEDGTVQHFSQWRLPKHAKARLGKGRITTMQFSPDGNQIALGSPIGIWLYDANTGKEFHLFPGPCGALAFSSDGRHLVNGGGTGFHGGEFLVWDTTTYQRVRLNKTPPETKALRLGKDGKTFVSIGYRFSNKKVVFSISTINPDIKQVETIDTEGEFAASLVENHLIALTQDIVAATGRSSEDNQIEIWDIASEKKISTLEGPEELPFTKNVVEVLALSSDGRLLATGSMNSEVRLWHTDTGTQIHTLQKHMTDSEEWNDTTALTFSPDDRMLACGNEDSTVQLWDITTGESIAVFTKHNGEIASMAFSPDSSILATASLAGSVLLWDTKTGDQLPIQIIGHPAGVYTMAFSQDSSTLTSIASNRNPTLWDLNTIQKLNLNSTSKFRIEGTRIGEGWSSFYAFSPDGTKLASIHGMDAYQVRLTDIQTGQELKAYNCPMRGSSSLARKVIFSPDGKTIAVGANGIIHLWNIENDKYKKIYLLDPKKNRRIFDLNYPRPLNVTRLVFSPSGKIIASGTMGGKVQMWHVETGIELCTFQEGQWFEEAKKKKDGNIHNIRAGKPITGLVFSPNGDMLAVSALGTTRFFKCDDQTQIKDIQVKRCDALVFLSDPSWLVNGQYSGKIELWDLTNRNKLNTLDGHTNGVDQFIFSDDGKTMASIGGEGTILVWDWEAIRKSSLENYDPLEQLKEKINSITSPSSERETFAKIANYGKNTKDKEIYVSMLNKIIQDMSHKLTVRLNATLVLAEYYRENGMAEKAEEYIQKTGFITEDKWLILGPFDNTDGNGFNTAYIPEDITHINLNAEYNGLNQKVRWQKSTDDTLNGYIHLGKDVDWRVAYAFATVISPDEREVQLRFDSDDQGKVWLNGTEVFTNPKSHWAEIDRYTVPVTLKAGKNSVLVKVCDEEYGWAFYLRITDPNGQPFDDLKINRNVQN